jgi:serine protease Do
MRTDAAINGGNSGGALFNAKGELIGITNAKSAGEETDNMGFALPITQVTYLCDNIRDNMSQSVKAAVLGATVEVKSSKASFDENGHVKITESLHVTEKASSSQADNGLFEVFDVLEWMQINDGEVHYLTRKYQLDDLLLTVRKGDRVTFGVKRDGGTSLEVVVNFSNNSHFRTYR